MMFGAVRDGIRRLFRLRIHDARLARADAEAELREYLRARVERLREQGFSAADAEAEALRRLGGSYEHAVDEIIRSAETRESDLSMREFLLDLKDDLRFAVRSFRREKHVATFIVITLALGIGANAAMYGVIDRLLLSGPAHVADPDQVLRFYLTAPNPRGDMTTQSFGWVSYDILRKRTQAFDAVAAYNIYSPGSTFGRGADAILIPVGGATYSLFPLLGVRPALGRFFNAAEDDPHAPQRVVVLGHGLWQRAFGRDSGVLGRSMTLGAVEYRIVGVAPRGFTGPQLAPVDAWVPMSLRSQGVTQEYTTAWNATWLKIIARVKDGVSAEQAATDATVAFRGSAPSRPFYQRASLFLAPLNANSAGKESSEVAISRWLVGVAAVVLLIACSNVANLLLARAVRRRREVAVRIALGAGRGRLVRLLLTESLLLAGAGAIVGLVVAWGGASVLRGILGTGIEWPSAPVDSGVLLISLALALTVGVLTGFVPALRASRPDLSVALKSGAREGGGHGSRLRAALTVAQAALSLVLLVGAGLFMRSLARVRGIDLGIQPDRVLVVQVRYPTTASIARPSDAAEVARRSEVLREGVLRARRLGGVETASLSIGLPFGSSFGVFERATGRDSIRLNGESPSISAVADGYFSTMGTRLLEGRAFTPADREGSEPAVIVNRTMATAVWPGKSPLGECLYWSESRDSLTTCSRVVGVVGDANAYQLREQPHMHYYVPFGQQRGIGGTTLLVRPKPGAEAEVIVAMRNLMVSIDPAISFVQATRLQDALDPQIRPWRLGAMVFSMLGLLALIVALVGLYSVMSYLVAQRAQEMGVRIALGASARNIATLVLRTSAGMALVGIVLGTVVALVTGRFIAPLLFDTSPRDPAVLGGVGGVLLVTSVLASVVPALRAKRVDPMEALRAE